VIIRATSSTIAARRRVIIPTAEPREPRERIWLIADLTLVAYAVTGVAILLLSVTGWI
jgi:hypothetical protein